MEQMILKAAVTATDQGVFTAVISTASVDREKDVVNPAGMVRALQKWAQTGKKLPLAWNHSRSPDEQVGHIDPGSAKQAGSEVVANGWIDQSTDVGQHVWRLVKSGTLGFSFGYLILQGTKRQGGGRNIDELDVFEVTATTTPMNNDTRVLDYKGAKQMDDGEDDDATETPLQAVQDAAEELQEFIDGERAEGDEADVAAARRLLAGLEDLIRAEQAQGEDKGLPAGAAWLFPEAELKAVRDGDLKAAWTGSYMNDLPDSAFLYVAPGGTKDSDGRTVPRSNRYFPYKDASGAVDLPHLRNALARIPQSDLPQSVKDQLTAKATRILDAQKSIVPADRTGKETTSRPVDPLAEKADALVLEFASDGESLRKPPQPKPAPTPRLTPGELRDRVRDLTLSVLTGVDEA